jgi:hypothetical protein
VSSAPSTITLRTPGALVEATMAEHRIYGPDIELARDGRTLRGRVFDNVVDLRCGDAAIEGSVAGGRTDLHLSERAGVFVLRGLYAGKLGELEIGTDRLVGQLGGCQYDLRDASGAGATYRGTRLCSRSPEPAELSLPPAVLPLPPHDRAVLLALVLGSG